MPRERVGPGKEPCARGSCMSGLRISKSIDSTMMVLHGRHSRCNCAAACTCPEHMLPRATVFRQDESPWGLQLNRAVLVKLTIAASRYTARARKKAQSNAANRRFRHTSNARLRQKMLGKCLWRIRGLVVSSPQSLRASAASSSNQEGCRRLRRKCLRTAVCKCRTASGSEGIERGLLPRLPKENATDTRHLLGTLPGVRGTSRMLSDP